MGDIVKGLVSCIVTTYKRDFAMLSQALDSIAAQTYPHIEMVVVSDNPPESEAAQALAPLMKQHYPQCLFLQLPKNSGAQVARNTGIRASHGEFTAFLDDDDMWMPTKIEKQFAAFADPEVGLAYCRGYQITGSDTEHHTDYSNARWGFHTAAHFDELLVRDYIGSTSQAMIRRSCYDTCGYFDEKLRARQDYDRWLAITSRCKAVGIDEALFYYRMHEGEQITKSPQVALEANAYVFHKYADGFRKNPTARMSYYYNRAYVLQTMGRKGAFLLNALHSFVISPSGFLRKRRSYREG